LTQAKAWQDTPLVVDVRERRTVPLDVERDSLGSDVQSHHEAGFDVGHEESTGLDADLADRVIGHDEFARHRLAMGAVGCAA